MRKHEGYEEVIEHEKTIETKESSIGDSSRSKDDEKTNENGTRQEEVKVLKKRGPKPRIK